MAEGLKLNLGCGNKILPGYVNVDYPDNYSKKPPDLACDIRVLPYATESVDEVMAIHVIEHLQIWDVPDVLKEWTRVLKPGGELILECPCLDKVVYFLGLNPLVASHTLFALYGDPGYRDERMMHKWCYSIGQLTALMKPHFSSVRHEQAKFHKPERDMRLIGTK